MNKPINLIRSQCLPCFRDLELNRSSSAVSMSCDNSDYSYATKYSLGHGALTNMTELLEEPVEEKPEQVGRTFYISGLKNLLD